ncbi:chromate transporter [Cytobacillus purgationiresistens]|uniref:Chromate transporter n=1 Tax=Cytobacillus purgationiresistens TaxID=863449 RepID=A0ABU0AP07_9BACI|nr:chromate transporter [Cytobacillus purgationiresistens]MDQ0271790.1 chromate transporter [Cytobacillus purgationiresistens]
MIYWQIFLAFFIPGILGYGGGPSSIPLIENEVVGTYGWMTTQEFSEVLAAGNSLPGPIATKLAAYIGFVEGGVLGGFIALFATIAPSIILMLLLMAILLKHKDKPQVKNISKIVRPVIAVLLAVMTYQFAKDSIISLGTIYTILMIIGSYILLEKVKLHPAFVIVIALAVGAITGLYIY